MSYQALRTFFMYISLFLVGGFIYGIIEVTYRGYTHPSMFILGGVCLILIGLMQKISPTPDTLYCSAVVLCHFNQLTGVFHPGLLSICTCT